MKAVIVEIKKRRAAALTKDGQIIKIKNNHFEIGQVTELNDGIIVTPRKKFVWAISAAAMVCFLSIGSWMFFAPYTYVSLDVNPSIEYSVNRFYLVLNAQAVNGDGAEIIENMHLQYRSIYNAVSTTVDEIRDKGYFSGSEQGGIIIATSCRNKNEADQLAVKLEEELQNQLDEENVDVEAVSVGEVRVIEARALGITPGKLNLIEKLQESSVDPDSIKIEDWMNKPVKEIMKTIKENKKNSDDNTDTTNEEINNNNNQNNKKENNNSNKNKKK